MRGPQRRARANQQDQTQDHRGRASRVGGNDWGEKLGREIESFAWYFLGTRFLWGLPPSLALETEVFAVPGCSVAWFWVFYPT